MKEIRLAFGLATLVALSACATKPQQLAMVPQEKADGFGYSEINAGAGRAEIRYLTPEISLPVDDQSRAATLIEQKQKAYELALWRAAQVALAGGYKYLSIEQDKRDADITISQEEVPVATGAYSVYGPGGMLYPSWAYQSGPRFGQPGIGTPFIIYDDPFAYKVHTEVSGRIAVALAVTFANAPASDAIDAKDTAERLAKQYSGATY